MVACLHLAQDTFPDEMNRLWRGCFPIKAPEFLQGRGPWW